MICSCKIVTQCLVWLSFRLVVANGLVVETTNQFASLKNEQFSGILVECVSSINLVLVCSPQFIKRVSLVDNY